MAQELIIQALNNFTEMVHPCGNVVDSRSIVKIGDMGQMNLVTDTLDIDGSDVQVAFRAVIKAIQTSDESAQKVVDLYANWKNK